MKVKVVLILFVILVITNVLFFWLWRNKSIAFTNKCQELETAETLIDSLKTNNEKLVEYISQKDSQIKEIEKTYSEKLNNIPKDTCGDQKPSAELLKYLRSN